MSFQRLLKLWARTTSLFLCGCAMFGGDTIIRVKGQLMPIEKNFGSSKCRLSISVAASDREVSYRNIDSVFETSFTLMAKREDYKFKVECPDGSFFHSETFTLGDQQSFNSLIDLGDINLSPHRANGIENDLL